MLAVVAILTLAVQADARVAPSPKQSGLPFIAGGAVLLLLGAPRFRRKN